MKEEIKGDLILTNEELADLQLNKIEEKIELNSAPVETSLSTYRSADSSDKLPEEDITSRLLAYQKSDIIKLASNDMDVLAGLALAEVLTLLYPPVFKAIWQLITTSAAAVRDFTQLAIGLPRGFGKTTVIKLFILWLILFSTKKYILITASNQEKARRILADVRRLFSQPNIYALFGNILADKETDNQDILIFTFQGRLITIQALGSGGDPRGSNVGFSRPDVILSDDVQSRENAMSQTQSAALRDWYYATLMPAKSELGCLFVYIGNMFATDGCLLKEFRDSPDWVSFIAGAILSDGESIWSEFKTLEEIILDFQKAIRAKNTAIFFSEILNDATASGAVAFNPEAIKVISPAEATMNEGKYIVIDPAGDKKDSNDTAIGVGVLHDGKPALKRCIRGVFSPLETITKAINLAAEEGAGVICVEAYAYQSSLLYWFEYVCKMNGIYGLEFYPITRGGGTKNGAILNMMQQLQKQEIALYPEVVGEVLTDIVRFNPQTSNNKDDLLDILVYLPLVHLKYSSEIGRLFNQTIDLDGDIEVISTDYNCPI